MPISPQLKPFEPTLLKFAELSRAGDLTILQARERVCTSVCDAIALIHVPFTPATASVVVAQLYTRWLSSIVPEAKKKDFAFNANELPKEVGGIAKELKKLRDVDPVLEFCQNEIRDSIAEVGRLLGAEFHPVLAGVLASALASDCANPQNSGKYERYIENAAPIHHEIIRRKSGT